ncbi:MAG: preQ(1) synthase [Thermodesulfobacteriota bacterium]
MSTKTEELTILSAGERRYPLSPEEATLESFPNRFENRDYTVKFDCPEFTSLCPITGQPDFAKIVITYVPKHRCLESKSLKLYLGSFRSVGMFHEEITNRILDDAVAACEPKWMRVVGSMNPRGGISIQVTAEYCMPGYDPPENFRD